MNNNGMSSTILSKANNAMQAQKAAWNGESCMSKGVVRVRRGPVLSNVPMGKRIAEARKRKGLTQEDLAEELGVTHGAVGLWEVARASPSRENEAELERVLGVSAKWLRTGRNEVSPMDDTESEILILAQKMGVRKKGRLLKYMQAMHDEDKKKN